MDKIIDPLADFFIQEAIAFEKENQDLKRVVQSQRLQLQQANQQVAARNRLLAQVRAQYRQQRILVRIEERVFVYQRNGDGIFTPIPEEPANEIARRLGFDSESETESDDLMDRLMADE